MTKTVTDAQIDSLLKALEVFPHEATMPAHVTEIARRETVRCWLKHLPAEPPRDADFPNLHLGLLTGGRY